LAELQIAQPGWLLNAPDLMALSEMQSVRPRKPRTEKTRQKRVQQIVEMAAINQRLG